MLEDVPPIPPEKVLDAIERDLDRGQLMVYPDFTAKAAVFMRRFMPGIAWRGAHRTEGI